MKEPIWIEARDALVLHDRLLALDGGAPDVRDMGLLESALARPRQHLAYGTKSSIVELAAIYTQAIVRNHPFVDGNKRTAFLLGVLFLELNGLRFTAAEADAAQAMISLAAGELTETEYEAFLGANVEQDS